MSATAQRFTAKPSQRVDVPKVPKVTREEAQRLPLLDRVLLQEHQRHADKLAEIRRVADKLAGLEAFVQAAQAEGAVIDVERVRMGFCKYSQKRDTWERGVEAVVLRANDPAISEWRKPKEQNAVANALLADGWRVVEARADGSEISLDRVAFMKGRRAVETTVMRQWIYDAIEAGHITADTQGKHPASDTGTPMKKPSASEADAARAH